MLEGRDTEGFLEAVFFRDTVPLFIWQKAVVELCRRVSKIFLLDITIIRNKLFIMCFINKSLEINCNNFFF